MSSPAQQRDLESPVYFTLLPDGKSRSKAFLAAAVFECSVLVLTLVIAARWPRELQKPPRYRSVTPLYLAMRVDSRLPVPRVPIHLPRPLAPKAIVLPPPPRAMVEPRHVRMAEIPAVKPEFQMPAASMRQPERPRPTIHTGVFSASAPRASKPQLQAKLRSGGFGDPFGAQPIKTADSGVRIAQVGSFDSPVGPGAANGSGGDPGGSKMGLIGSFGDAVVASGPVADGPQGGGIRAGVFSNQAAAPAASAPVRTASPAIQPLEILDKPDPVYTVEARERKIEGTVVLDAIFEASGSVDVLQVLNGLGYGLDQAAMDAARRIRFQPERLDGKPVSVRARLRIVFRLAY